MRRTAIIVSLWVLGISLACSAINVKPAAITYVISTGASTAQVGVAYSGTVTASGGNGSFTWTESGALPPGINWTSSANVVTISGTPTSAGTYSPSWTACDTESPALCGNPVTVDPVILPAKKKKEIAVGYGPNVTSIMPNVFTIGYTMEFDIKGSGFNLGATVSFTNGSTSFACENATVISDTEITCWVCGDPNDQTPCNSTVALDAPNRSRRSGSGLRPRALLGTDVPGTGEDLSIRGIAQPSVRETGWGDPVPVASHSGSNKNRSQVSGWPALAPLPVCLGDLA